MTPFFSQSLSRIMALLQSRGIVFKIKKSHILPKSCNCGKCITFSINEMSNFNCSFNVISKPMLAFHIMSQDQGRKKINKSRLLNTAVEAKPKHPIK